MPKRMIANNFLICIEQDKQIAMKLNIVGCLLIHNPIININIFQAEYSASHKHRRYRKVAVSGKTYVVRILQNTWHLCSKGWRLRTD